MTTPKFTNTQFELRGFNHIALVCRDMAETVAWYSDVLGMKLVKTIGYDNGGQHFFLDMGNGVDGVAFFWFPDAPEGIPGVSVTRTWNDDMEVVGKGTTAIGTMHHLAFDVAPEKFDEYVAKLRAKGIPISRVTNHSTALQGHHKPDWDPASDGGDVFVRSVYFKDPNGIVLEFACWTTTFDESDVIHEPRTAAELDSAQRPVGV